ncbi:DUF3306 domain-containing protein [Vibrio algivorus]|uniref:DUF3306 domain-containing protein n=1 Tax=Vibrio algivorus TaxID=1667024 RepID=A0ABQ6ELZ9_9VIBR|nr:DUF3306 domain-containing protein [Vibrio algivorus]GLT14001.1 hypothetical protein GCM10007931_09750 [Vibrio algivorus]
MVTNRFQRWLTKKNESLEGSQEVGAQLTAQAEDVVDSTDANSNAETFIEPKTDSSISINQQPNAMTSQDDGSEGETTQDSSLTTIAHVFADGFSKQEKQQQLRALFHSDEFSGIDPLDSYNMDYTKVKSLSKDVAETLRSWHKRVEEVFDDDEALEMTDIDPEKLELGQGEQEPFETEETVKSEINSHEVNKNNAASTGEEGGFAKVKVGIDNKKSG